MKIAFFNSYYSPDIGGGAEVTLKVLVESMRNAGHEVMVFCQGREKGVRLDQVDGVQVVRMGLENMYFPLVRDDVAPSRLDRFLWHFRDQDNRAVVEAIASELNKFAPDVASCHNLAGMSVSVWAHLEARRIPIVQVLHDQYLLCPKTSMTKGDSVCEKQCFDCGLLRRQHASKSRSVNAVVGVSRYILDKLFAAGYFAEARDKYVINNVRNPNFWQNLVSDAEPRKSHGLTFGYIGGITPIKGVELLLADFLSSDLPADANLRIAGSGDAAYVEGLKARYPGKRIEWLGYSTPKDFYSSIDVLVVPSIWHDTLPGVVFEAFGYGLPVVGSTRGGIPEMVQHGVNGLLFDPAVPGALAGALQQMSNPDLLARFSVAAEQSSEAFKDVVGWVKSYEDVYRRASAVAVSG
jgi:glycosyltransferase involved in cell wall biosynthesis